MEICKTGEKTFAIAKEEILIFLKIRLIEESPLEIVEKISELSVRTDVVAEKVTKIVGEIGVITKRIFRATGGTKVTTEKIFRATEDIEVITEEAS